MRTNAIQSETFGSTTTVGAVKAAQKGYAVLIDGQKFFVGSAKDKGATFAQAKNNLSLKYPECKINYLA